MTKHTKYSITTRIYRSHLSKYVFVIFVQAAESKPKYFVSLTHLNGPEPIFTEGQNSL